jgi:hypothetical protein
LKAALPAIFPVNTLSPKPINTTMKKAILILLAATSLVACTKNDDFAPQPSGPAPATSEQAQTEIKKITPADKVPTKTRHESTPVKTRG